MYFHCTLTVADGSSINNNTASVSPPVPLSPLSPF